MNATSTYHHDSAFGAPSDVPLFVRGVEDPGGMGGGDGYADDGSDAHELRESQRRVAEASARGDEASARSLALELELEAQALKRMGLEKELNDVHREHSKQMAAKQQAHDQLRNDFEKLQHYNLKLREELLRTNRELIGVLAKRNEIRKEADRAARQNLRNEIRQEQQQAADAAGVTLPADYDGGLGAPALPPGVAFPGAPPPALGRKATSGVATPPSLQDPATSRPPLAQPPPPHASNVNPLAAARHGPTAGPHDGDPARSVRSGHALRDLRDFFDM